MYDGRIVRLSVDRVRFPDGSEGEREIVRHPGSAAAVPVRWEPEPRVVLLRQYRYAADGEIWEIPAGKLDDGEDPGGCARRELEEEAGLRAGELRRLTSLLPTPGFCDERVHLFVASGLEEVAPARERREFIRPRELPLGRALEMVDAGEIVDGKTVAGLLLVDRARERLGG